MSSGNRNIDERPASNNKINLRESRDQNEARNYNDSGQQSEEQGIERHTEVISETDSSALGTERYGQNRNAFGLQSHGANVTRREGDNNTETENNRNVPTAEVSTDTSIFPRGTPVVVNDDSVEHVEPTPGDVTNHMPVIHLRSVRIACLRLSASVTLESCNSLNGP